MSEVRVLKLVTGEELVGNIVTNADSYNIKDPLIIFVQTDGQLGMMHFAPYMNLDGDFTINKAHVVYSMPPSRGLKNSFIEATTGVKVTKTPIPQTKPGLVLG